MATDSCYHCGNACASDKVVFDDKTFCCQGCKTVYEIFSDNDLSYYYELEKGAGVTPNQLAGKYDFLNNKDVVAKLLEFDEDERQIVNLTIPQIHCSSCIWLLENLNKLNESIIASQVDFPKKKVRVTYKSSTFP